jgi:hypothetical protein
MLSLLNAVQVIPVACVDFLHQTLAKADIHVPVLLKAHRDRVGWLTLCGWVPGQTDPVCRDMPTEMMVCPAEREQLKAMLEEFCAEIRAGEKNEKVAFLAELTLGVGVA